MRSRSLRTDWYRNVHVAGECVIGWKGRDYPVGQPEVIDAAAANGSFVATARAVMTRVGIGHCLRLRHQSETRPRSGYRG